MAKNGDLEDLVKAGALIGGMWLAVEILKNISNKAYRCPVCQNEIKYGVNPCPYCKSNLKWTP